MSSAREGRALLRAWLESVGLDEESCPGGIVEVMQAKDFTHAAFYRRSRRIHERRLADATEKLTAAATAGEGYGEAATALFDACLPAVPYVPSTAILASEKAKLTAREGEPRRVGLLVDAAGSMHGVTHTIERIREIGVPGYDVEVIGTDARVDRRLPAVAEVDVPFYTGLSVGVPSIPELIETIADGRYELLHLVSPGPAGIGAAIAAKVGGTPICGSYHTELGAYAALRAADPRIEAGMRMALAMFYGQCEVVLSPSPSSDESLAALGIDPAANRPLGPRRRSRPVRGRPS